ncbi:glycosyltransferase family 1 protein [Melanomma pulvis-pyrius CBS 109.77]|uniref:UDP-N-acetylglucosamine transferase subunit ALG14 n=1 Tax=Melanomma pulvis-pyrius CBS 109.77 TaxID=1314802 RepID=A0A6A6XPN8_9PLEO|nr:glycosyltransferase family 1 protein [Melanomma pulvis-pyrius CBS 109.77]
MPPTLSSLDTWTFFLALFIIFLVASTLRLIAILPSRQFRNNPFRRQPAATRVFIVLGSGGHTHEMFYLLRDLDTRKYTHRTYVVSSGDAFSAQRAAEFEKGLEGRERERERESALGNRKIQSEAKGSIINGVEKKREREAARQNERPPCTGPDHYNITTLHRARAIHQSLLTTPFTSILTLLSSFGPLLAAPPLLPNAPPTTPYEAAAQDLPDLIITNGPATAVIVVLASLILKFFDIRGASSRGKCRTVYVESFARVTSLSLSGRLLVKVVDRFVVQWAELEGRGGRAEFWGVLV